MTTLKRSQSQPNRIDQVHLSECFNFHHDVSINEESCLELVDGVVCQIVDLGVQSGRQALLGGELVDCYKTDSISKVSIIVIEIKFPRKNHPREAVEGTKEG